MQRAELQDDSHGELLQERRYVQPTVPFLQCCGSMTFLGWIRIRGSMPLTNGSGFGSCFFRH